MPKRIVDVRDREPLLDIVSYGRAGPGRRTMTPREVQQVSRTIRRVPEVMVKVSGGGRSLGAVEAHLKYIGRKGALEIHADDGEQLSGKGAGRDLLEDWDLDLALAMSPAATANSDRSAPKLVHNIVLSMPAGTDPRKLLKAAKAFARETFALRHRYAMVLHTDQQHPHVHLVVKAVSEQGKRLNIRKADLREWRQQFARHLREQGVAANATERVARGHTSPRLKDGLLRAALRGKSMRLGHQVPSEDALRRRTSQRRLIERGWRAMSRILLSQGYEDLAAEAQRFVAQMPPIRTENDDKLRSPPTESHQPRDRAR